MARVARPETLEPTALTDEELACRTQEGSSACFGELVCRHEDRLLRFLMRKTRRVQDAEDLLQETFARAYERIALYNPAWKVTTWLFTIASRLACSRHRKRRAEFLPDTRHLEDPGRDPAAIAAQREQAERLWALAADVLSGNQYTASWLRCGEDMSVKEISQVMKKTQTNVKVLLYRGRSTLAGRLDQVAPRSGLPHAGADGASCVAPARGGG